MHIREVATFADFHQNLTGRKVRTETVYGFWLENNRKERRYCIGLECRDGRPNSYLDALRPPWAGGGQKKNPQAWKKAPSLAKLFWAQDFFYKGQDVILLRGAPVSFETAAALEVISSGASCKEHVCGGLFALDQTKPHVKDALCMLLWHDAGKCVCCGEKHFSGTCALGMPPEMRKLHDALALANGSHAATSSGVASATAQAGIPGKNSGISSSTEEHPLKADLKRVADGVEQMHAAKRARLAADLEQQARDRAAELEAGPLTTSEDAWKTSDGPRLPEGLLRSRLEKYLVPEAFRSEAEAALGGECVDLFAFAKAEIFAAHSRKKDVMQGARTVCKNPQLQKQMAGAWIQGKYKAHVAAAIKDGRLLGHVGDFLQKHQLRPSHPTHGVVVRLAHLLALYKR